MAWVLVTVLVLVLVAWYLTYTAARLDRLHIRLHGTLAALDAQLVRRAEAAIELANSGIVDGATALILTDAATESIEATTADDQISDRWAKHVSERQVVESHLTQTLCAALTPEVLAAADPAARDLLGTRLARTCTRVQLARTFHNDAVTDVQQLRRKPLVRIFHLAGHTPLPATVDFNDELPTALG